MQGLGVYVSLQELVLVLIAMSRDLGGKLVVAVPQLDDPCDGVPGKLGALSAPQLGYLGLVGEPWVVVQGVEFLQGYGSLESNGLDGKFLGGRTQSAIG